MNYGPMLASPTTGSSKSYKFDLKQLNKGAYIAQYKLDGHRAMLHKNGKSVAILSRSGKNITQAFPQIVEEALRRLPDKIILDGELMTDNRDPNEINRIISGTPGTRVARFYAFDVPSMARSPLHMRLATLRGIGSSTYIRPLQAHSDLERALERAVKAGHEGIVVKHIGSPYEFDRRSPYWLKFKAVETITCAVTNYDLKDGTLTRLHLGLVKGGDIVDVGRVSGGWNQATSAELVKRLTKNTSTLVDVEYLPGGKGLRFGTFRNIRDDLTVSDATYSQIG